MSGGPENVTNTTNSQPPKELRGAYRTAGNAVEGQFTRNRGSGSPGNRLTGAAQDLNLSTLKGDYLNPDTNPYLESTFNRAADLTRGRLDSEFSGAGRNLGASMPARSEELQTLASNIYGGNYQRERGIQNDAMGMSQTLDPTNRFVNQLAGLTPGAGGVTSSTQPYFKTGLF